MLSTNKTEVVLGETNSFAYAYNAMGRLTNSTLTAATNPTPLTVSYSYDANGNRTLAEKGSQGSVASYQVDAQDRLVSVSTVSAGVTNGTAFSYNLAGDLTSATSASSVVNYSYDSFGNLLSAELNGTNIAYTVDPLNRRIGKSVNGAPVQKFLYQNQINPVAELDGSNRVVSLFVYGHKDHVPAYMIQGTNTYRILSDSAGSVRLVVNADTGEVAQRIDYDEFGNVLRDTHPGFQPFGFQGGLYDRDTGLVRFGARDYDPTIGRWLTKDPPGFEAGINFYAFCGNDPVNKIDPFGLGDYEAGFWELFGNALNNTADAIGQSFGQMIYDAVTGHWSSDQWKVISDLMWSTDTPAHPEATPYIEGALAISATATSIALIAGTTEAITGVRVELHGAHFEGCPPHLQGIKGSPGVHAYEWGKTIWRWPPH
jgi:RHS repeat-associated protein